MGDESWKFIDWDATAPSTALWDLAWSCISFPPFEPNCDLDAAASAMHALLSGYELNPSHHRELIGFMVTRARAEQDFIVKGARAGQQPWVKLHDEEHHRYWGPVADYLERNAMALESALVSLDSTTNSSQPSTGTGSTIHSHSGSAMNG